MEPPSLSASQTQLCNSSTKKKAAENPCTGFSGTVGGCFLSSTQGCFPESKAVSRSKLLLLKPDRNVFKFVSGCVTLLFERNSSGNDFFVAETLTRRARGNCDAVSS